MVYISLFVVSQVARMSLQTHWESKITQVYEQGVCRQGSSRDEKTSSLSVLFL